MYWLLGTLALTAAILTASAVYGRTRFGSIRAALAYLNGDRITVENPLEKLGQLRPGSTYRLSYRLSNHGGSHVRLLGATSSCTCTMVESLPDTLPPGATCDIAVSVAVPTEAVDGRGLLGGVSIVTDDPAHAVIQLQFQGDVEARPQER